ncbi:MAG: hypothetical protein JRE47_13145 [Deltaproteobacteria bacterium]|nr:hypothetical protein [Deltaproteobacteria bacterium]
MKSLSAISKKGMIVIPAVIMIIAGGLVALLPSASQAMNGGGWGKLRSGSGSGDIHVSILNNTGEVLTIRKMYINTPGDDELRVRAIYFVGEVNNSYTAGSYAYSQKRNGQTTEDLNKIISFDNDYGFSNAKVECIIKFDNQFIPSGTYNLKYYFKYDDDAATTDRTNTVTFNLP